MRRGGAIFLYICMLKKIVMFRYCLVCLRWLIPSVFSVFVACGGSSQQSKVPGVVNVVDKQPVKAPEFDADSAYSFVAGQLVFGPRVPNSEAHIECGLWLRENLERFADTVYIQQARIRAYNGDILNIKNIIGVFQPEKRNRILLCAHWDSRPYADWDPDPANHYRAIDGANDGASGVGVLLEVARALSTRQPGWGADIVFFDAEDYGKHRQAAGADADSWALGSQYWAKNPHISNYQAVYGILLDMVGAEHATFKKEGYSMMYAPNIVRKVWRHARNLGYDAFFVEEEGGFITDDHYYINTIRNIPTINIIHLDASTPHGFFPHWHTVNDKLDAIDPFTLKAVGQTVLEVIYQE